MHFKLLDVCNSIFCILYFSPQGGVDADGKDDLDSGDEAEGKKIDTEEVMNASICNSMLNIKNTLCKFNTNKF